MKKSLISKSLMALSGLACVATSAVAQAPAPESTLSYNLGVVSEYRYRGLAQSRFQPTVQGGVDYADKSGLYVGAWATTIKWIDDVGKVAANGTKGNVELDLYGGYKFPIGDLTMDVGYLRYEYVKNTLAKKQGFKNANTDEIYAAGTYGPFTLKYSYALSDLFGQNSSTGKSTKGSTYLDLSATFDLGNGFSLVPHVGKQTVKNIDDATYTDYALTLNKDLGNGLSASVAWINTNAKATYYYVPTEPTKNLGKSSLVVGVQYSF
ncbi:MAG: TorF family putative porin [Alphaproteobacteria bacterium]|nr:TorF family putative porin [Alphaproteobacteria bacterium]